LDFNPNDFLLGTGCSDGIIRLWDVRNMKCVASEYSLAANARKSIFDVHFGSNGMFYASGVGGQFNSYFY